ncbi:hypothetical protein [Bryobacter aggregatus]|uniref:hypothetical protein n=1 Tax=Bryobacter aggregatus TaxID=360054 RepID=UPI0004E2036A|nr:hypothetical protein [Bryobacter aggregatus]
MAEATNTTQDSAKSNVDETALDMMKFIAVQTGYGKSTGQQTGFGAKGSTSPEQYADALLELFQRCKKTIKES